MPDQPDPAAATESPIPPARLAQLILDNIRATPDSFDMTCWADFTGRELLPGASLCGTTLCVAGWAAHLTGWTLVRSGEDVEIPATAGDGSIVGTDTTGVWAEKDGRPRLIWDIARDALDVAGDQTFWHVPDGKAIARLEAIAAG